METLLFIFVICNLILFCNDFYLLLLLQRKSIKQYCIFLFIAELVFQEYTLTSCRHSGNIYFPSSRLYNCLQWNYSLLRNLKTLFTVYYNKLNDQLEFCSDFHLLLFFEIYFMIIDFVSWQLIGECYEIAFSKNSHFEENLEKKRLSKSL